MYQEPFNSFDRSGDPGWLGLTQTLAGASQLLVPQKGTTGCIQWLMDQSTSAIDGALYVQK